MQRKLFALAPWSVIAATLLFTQASGSVEDDVSGIAEASAQQVVHASIRNMAYAPARIEVARGATVHWKNDDQVPHTVTGSGWGSGTLQTGGSYSHQFDSAGTFSFYCVPHPNMKGTVVVKG